MAYREFRLEPVDIGGGFMATNVWISTGPIVLVGTINRLEGLEVKSRLDLQKRVFIDPLPGERSEHGILDLVSSVVSASDGWVPSGYSHSM